MNKIANRTLVTCFIFNKLANLFCMVDIAVVNNEDTAWSRIGVGEWNL
jgi:hypothetical protein